MYSHIKIERIRQYQQEYKQSLLCFAHTIDVKDKHTNGHFTRIAKYSRKIAKKSLLRGGRIQFDLDIVGCILNMMDDEIVLFDE